MTTQERLLKALLQYLRKDTNEPLTVTEIAKATGLSRMTIYRYIEKFS